MKRTMIVGENFYGSIMYDPNIIPTIQLGVRIVHYWDEYQATLPDCDHNFIHWLAMIPGFAPDNNPDEVDVVIV